MKIAGEKLGWTVHLDENEGRGLTGKKLDLVICLHPYNEFSKKGCSNYLLVFHPFTYLDDKRRFKPIYEEYDGYLLTINDRKTLRKGLKEKNKRFNYIRFYPTVYNVPYKKLELNDLVVMIPVWGNRLIDSKFETLYKLLSDAGCAKFYGISQNKNIDPQYYMGSIPFDGTSVIDVLQRHGIALVFHSDIHNKELIPSSRVFEAAAASAVIISDENMFVKYHFGDSVFYIDTSASGESIFNQIQGHLNTISQDPKKALKMAKKAHQIFIKKFTMERQLMDLKDMDKKLKTRTKKGRGL